MEKIKVQLKLEHDNGVDDGKQLYSARTISNIAREATDENLLKLSGAISSLSQKEVLITKKIVTTQLD